MREIAVRACSSATAYVVVRLLVAPRPPGRLRHAGNGGRGRSDPPPSMPVVASSGAGMCTPSQPPRRVATGPAVLCRKARETLTGGCVFGLRGVPQPRCRGRPSFRWSRRVRQGRSSRVFRPSPRSGGALHGLAAKPGREPLRRGRRGLVSRANAAGGGRPRERTLAGERREQFGQRRQPEEDRLFRRVPQRRSDGLPARD